MVPWPWHDFNLQKKKKKKKEPDNIPTFMELLLLWEDKKQPPKSSTISSQRKWSNACSAARKRVWNADEGEEHQDEQGSQGRPPWEGDLGAGPQGEEGGPAGRGCGEGLVWGSVASRGGSRCQVLRGRPPGCSKNSKEVSGAGAVGHARLLF